MCQFDSLIVRKIIKTVATRSLILTPQCIKFDIGQESARTLLEELTALPQTSAGFLEFYFIGKKGIGRGKKEKGKEKEKRKKQGKRERKMKGKKSEATLIYVFDYTNFLCTTMSLLVCWM